MTNQELEAAAGVTADPLAEIREVLDKMTDDAMRTNSAFICQQIVGVTTSDVLPDLLDAVQARLAARDRDVKHYMEHAAKAEARLADCEEDNTLIREAAEQVKKLNASYVERIAALEAMPE
jgi:hypothetical protein